MDLQTFDKIIEAHTSHNPLSDDDTRERWPIWVRLNTGHVVGGEWTHCYNHLEDELTDEIICIEDIATGGDVYVPVENIVAVYFKQVLA